MIRTNYRIRPAESMLLCMSLISLLIAPATPNEVAALAEALKKGPLDKEEETYLTHAALVAQGHAKVEPECLTG